MNRKIQGATPVEENGLKFKSRLEKRIYDVLKEEGFEPQYEAMQFILIDSFIPTIPFYVTETEKQRAKRIKEKGEDRSRLLTLKKSVIKAVTYTPDFYFIFDGIDVYIEAKGYENDVYYIKKKLFLKLLSSMKTSSMFFEIRTLKQLSQAVGIIRQNGDGREKEPERTVS